MTILELREKRNKAWEAAKAFVETKRDKDGLLSDEDAKTYAEMEQKVQNYTSEIERMQAMEAMEAELNKPVNTPITHKPMNGGKDTGDGKAKTGRASDAYKAGMLKALRTNFRTISDVLSEGIDENGGYLVPEEYDSRIIDILNEENVVSPMSSLPAASTRLTSPVPSLRQRGSRKAASLPSVTLLSARLTSMPTSCMLQ